MSSSAADGNRRHALRIAALTVIATAIALPLVILVLGPNMPPGKDTTAGVSQVFDNTVLLVVMTPFTMFILIFILYSVLAFRVRPGDNDQRDGARLAGESRDGMNRRAFGGKGHRRAAAEAEIDAAGSHRLLQLGIAAVVGDLEIDAVFLPDALLLADLQRQERPQRDSGAGMHLVERSRLIERRSGTER